MKFNLSKPIQAHGQTLDSLELREPTPADVRAIKALPYFVSTDESVHIKPKTVAHYLERCATIPSTSVDQLSLSDFNQLCWVVAGFFLKQDLAPPTS